MKFLSLFSGIEAASEAWKPLGWECVGVSEIEPFPCALLAQRYPTVPNIGDITKVTELDIAALGAIDLVVFGSPCQDLSVAGKRKGLNGARSGLFFDSMRVVEWARKHGGCRFALWENVPGAFSSNAGGDFAVVVGKMAGFDTAEVPPKGWGTEGAIVGPQGMVEWSVLDAQWFGVAQRRRRVFALADFGDWASRPPILLEPESLRGDSAPSREAGQGVTHPVAPCLTSSGRGVERGGDTRGQDPVVAVSVALRAKTGPIQNQLGAGVICSAVCPTLRAGGNKTGGDRPPGTDVDTCESLIGVQRPVPVNIYGSNKREDRPNGGFYVHMYPPCSKTLDAATGLNPTCGQGGVAVLQPIVERVVVLPINNMCTRHAGTDGSGGNAGKGHGLGIGKETDPMFTLTKGDRHAVAYGVPICDTNETATVTSYKKPLPGESSTDYRQRMTDYETAHGINPNTAIFAAAFKGGQGSSAGGIGYDEHVSPTLSSADSGSNRTPVVMTNIHAVAYRTAGDGAVFEEGDRTAPLTTGTEPCAHVICQPIAVAFQSSQSGVRIGDVHATLDSNNGPRRHNDALVGMQVRRLTPVECERLQGFKDGHTAITMRGKPAADGPRYKALGNSMAVPVMAWIGKQIDHVTMFY